VNINWDEIKGRIGDVGRSDRQHESTGQSHRARVREGSVTAVRRRDARLVVLQVLFFSLIATLFLRVAWMQVGDSGQYRTAATANSVREVVVPAQRGLILDQQGRPMVANRSTLSVTVDRAELARQPDDGAAVLGQLATTLGTTPDTLTGRLKSCGTPGAPKQPLCWNGPNEQPVVVAEDVPQDVGLQLMESEGDFKAVRTELTPTRSYPSPYGINFAHAAGYLGQMTSSEVEALDEENRVMASSAIGRAGLEQRYNDVLMGTPGVQQVAVSRSGSVTDTLRDDSAVPGDNLVTSVDAKLQAVVEKQLMAAIELGREQGKPSDSGTIVVTDLTNGRVLAMASAPTYDPEVWVGGIEDAEYTRLTDEKEGNPLLNRATQGTYAPASTFKAISAAAAIKAGYDPNKAYACPSSYSVGGQAFRNYESKAYGLVDFARALAVSCDTVFYRLAHELWEADGGIKTGGNPTEAIYQEARSFGLGQRTGIDIPGESPGRVVGRETRIADYAERKDDFCLRAEQGYPELKSAERAELLKSYAQDYCAEGDRYRAGDALNFSIGQGDTVVTPLQMNSAYAAIANGGTLWQPQFAKAAVSRDGEVRKEFAPVSNGQVDASDSTLSYLRRALTTTSESGTTKGVFDGFPLSEVGGVAAKTGTAEVVGKTSTAWVSSFAPADAPKYAVTCMVSQGGTGSGTCGPSVRAIYEALFGVTGQTVNPKKSVLVGGEPATALPQISSDGLGANSNPDPSATDAEVAVTQKKPTANSQPSSPVAAGGESPVPNPTQNVETPVGVVPSRASGRGQ
jgi:penicillin-binding protein 2